MRETTTTTNTKFEKAVHENFILAFESSYNQLFDKGVEGWRDQLRKQYPQAYWNILLHDGNVYNKDLVKKVVNVYPSLVDYFPNDKDLVEIAFNVYKEDPNMMLKSYEDRDPKAPYEEFLAGSVTKSRLASTPPNSPITNEEMNYPDLLRENSSFLAHTVPPFIPPEERVVANVVDAVTITPVNERESCLSCLPCFK